MPDEMIASQEPTKKGKPIVILAVILALIIAGLIWWQYSQKEGTKLSVSLTPEESTKLSVSPTPEIGLPSQFDWQSYDNIKYGYSLKYPKHWVIDVALAEKDFANNVGGELIISNYSNPLTLLESSNPPTDLAMMFLSIHQVNAQTTVDQFIEKQKDYFTPFSESPVNFSGREGKQLLYVFPRGDTEILNIKTILKRNTNMFVFSYFSFKPDKFNLPKTVETIHDEIMRSLAIK